MARHYDQDDQSVVVVIGSGAGGGTLANELAQQGIDVVCLEAGSHTRLGDFRNDPALMAKKLGWHDAREGSGEMSRTNPTFVCKTVGGTTTHWTALALRMQPHELAARTTYGEVPYAQLIDWPISYDDLAPYYDLAEKKMGVAGTHGLPRHPPTNHFRVLDTGAVKAGYPASATANLAINPVPYDGRPACRQSGFCVSGCIYGAKWSTLYTEIPKALATGHFELRPDCMVTRILQGTDGRVTGVVYRDAAGVERRQKARAVAVAGNAIETARLLLLSRSPLSPDGLGNQNGHVGRHYMRHVFTFVLARMPGKVSMYKGIVQIGSLSHEAHHDPARGFASGYHIETVSMTPARLAGSLMAHESWGRDFADAMADYENFAVALTCGEDFPARDNRVTLHTSRTDQYQLPIPVVHYERDDNARAMAAHAYATSEKIFRAVGATKTYRQPSRSATHNMGTARMAKTERDGVCDGHGQVFGISNLFVADGSAFSTSSTANPTLTIVALAIRQAGHIRRRMVARTI